MFIPDHSIIEKEEGVKVILRNDYQIKGGTFTKGHIFTIIDKSANGLILQDDDGNIIYNISNRNVVTIEKLEESRNESIRIEKFNKKLSIIEQHCKKRQDSWEEYEHWYSCKVDGKQCSVSSECEKYCEPEVLRKFKIKELKK